MDWISLGLWVGWSRVEAVTAIIKRARASAAAGYGEELLGRPISNDSSGPAKRESSLRAVGAPTEGCPPSVQGFVARRGRSRCKTVSLARGLPDIRHSIRFVASVATSAVAAPEVFTTGSSSLMVS